jgi:peptidyl-prolyl cis-trans isomerase C
VAPDEVESEAPQPAETEASNEAEAAAPANVRLPSGVLAIVDDETIDVAEFERLAQPRAENAGGPLPTQIKRDVLDQLVSQELLLAAARAEGLDRDPEVRRAMVKLLLRRHVYPGADELEFTDEDARRYYDENLERYEMKAALKIEWILIRAGEDRSDDEARTELEEIRAKIVSDPDSFGELAQEHSEGFTPRRGGNLGYVTKKGRPGLDPELVELAFGLEDGELSPVFRTAEGYNLIRVPGRREPKLRSFEAVKKSVLRGLKQRHLNALLDEYMAERRQVSVVQVDEEQLAALEVLPSPAGSGDEDEAALLQGSAE